MMVPRITPSPDILRRIPTPSRGGGLLRVPTPSSGVPRAVIYDQNLLLRPAAGALPGTLQLGTPTPTPAIQEAGLASFFFNEITFLPAVVGDGAAGGQALQRKKPPTIETIFHALAHASGLIEHDERRLNQVSLRDLGYRIDIHRPLGDGSGQWARSKSIQNGETAVVTEFSEKRVPNENASTVDRMILQSKPNCLYGVNPDEPDLLVEIHLPSPADRAGYENQAIVGPGWQYYIKLGSTHGDEAVVQIDKISQGESAGPLKAEDPVREIEGLRVLKHYFTHEVLPAIDTVRRREVVTAEAAPTPRPGLTNRPASAGVEVTHKYLAALPEVRIGGPVHLFFSFIIQHLRLALGLRPKEVAKLVEFYKPNGQRIRAYLDYPENVADPKMVPWVIIPPAFGKTKETMFYEALDLKMNGFGVLRYDDTCSVGESSGEMRDQTLSESTANIRAAIDYLSMTINPSQIGLGPVSFSARASLKAASQDSRIKFMLPLMGAPAIESVLQRVCGEDLVAGYLSGRKSGPMNILGHTVDGTNFINDASRAKFLDLASTLEDMEKVKIPIIWFCGDQDPWIDIAEVRRVLAVNPFGAYRDVKIFHGLSHRLRESGEAPKVFAEVVRSISLLTTGEEMPYDELVLPKANAIVAKMERERSRVRPTVTKEQEIEGWTAYMKGYDILLQLPEYRDYLETIWKLLELQPGENLLDVGTGTANLLALGLAKMGTATKQTGWESGKLVGVDLVQEALGRAGQKVERAKAIWSNLPPVEFHQVDIAVGALPHEDGAYDKIVASLFLSYLQDPAQAVKEMCAELKKGGTIVLTSLKPGADIAPMYARFMANLQASTEIDKEEKLQLGREMLNSVAHWIEAQEESGLYRYLSGEELIKLLKANGIEIVAEESSFGDLAVAVVGRKKGKKK